MTAEVKRKFTPDEAMKRRDQAMSNMALDIARVFKTFPLLRSAVVFVAQYWNDEADDAVHFEMAYSLSEQPDINKHLAESSRSTDENREFLFIEGDETAKAVGYRRWQSFTTPTKSPSRGVFGWLLGSKPRTVVPETSGATEDEYSIWLDLENLLRGYSWDHRNWDSNGEAISLFSAFTKEGAHQDMSTNEAYLPYAIFRRTSDGKVAIEVVGKMVRPWLDGIAPEYEDEEPAPFDAPR